MWFDGDLNGQSVDNYLQLPNSVSVSVRCKHANNLNKVQFGRDKPLEKRDPLVSEPNSSRRPRNKQTNKFINQPTNSHRHIWLRTGKAVCSPMPMRCDLTSVFWCSLFVRLFKRWNWMCVYSFIVILLFILLLLLSMLLLLLLSSSSSSLYG